MTTKAKKSTPKTKTPPKSSKAQAKPDTPAASASPTPAASRRNLIVIILTSVIGLLLIAGSAVLSIILLPKSEPESSVVDQPNTEDEITIVVPNQIVNPDSEEKSESEVATAASQTETESKETSSKPNTTTTNSSTATKKPSTTATATSAAAKPSTTNTSTASSSTSSDGCNGSYWVETINGQTTIMCESDRPTFVKKVTEDKSELVANKFGTKVWRDIKQTYDLYSDGSKRNVSGSNNLRYDYSGYNATTAQLKAEANSLKSSERSTINQVLAQTNQLRAEKGLAPLQLDENLTTVASFRAAESAWAGQFSHTRPNGTSCFTAGTELGAPFYGENMAFGSASMTASKAVTMWRNSAGHYSNIIDAKYTKTGIGIATCGDKKYFVQVFAY